MAAKRLTAPAHMHRPAGEPSGLTVREASAAAFAVAGEAIVVLLAFSGDVPVTVTVIVHAAITLIAAAILFWNRPGSEDRTVAAVLLLVIVVSGPAGAAAALAMLPFAGHAGAGPQVLKAWYARLANADGGDRATVMHDRVTAGRVVRFDDRPPEDFAGVIANGTLAQRQAALGLIARTFHTDFAPALALALRSPEPVVRTQAAAVVARVRSDLKLRLKTLLATAAGHGAGGHGAGSHRGGLAAAAELLRLADCGLVDRADSERCRRGADTILAKALATERDVTTEAARGNRETALVIEGFLLTAGRLKDFRVSRRIHDLMAGRRYRVRRIGSQPVPG